jgi:uncharacterized metal-binding protein
MVAYYEDDKEEKGLLLLLLGPILGLVYVIFLPFIAIAAIITLIGVKIGGGTLNLIRNAVSFGWRPREAYLTGKKRGKKDKS